MSDPIPFAPSARNKGAVCINPTRLKAGLTYQVLVDDNRGDLLKGLSDEELDQIKAVFDQYDQNRNGSISRLEIDELVRDRVAERKQIIDEKFEALTLEPGVSPEVIQRAEECKKQHYQSLQESQNKLIHMFEMADVDGDGVISFTEFMLAEAWWLKCAINPDKQHLF
jgi:Ca2+-binding EF-hand superfamily protein